MSIFLVAASVIVVGGFYGYRIIKNAAADDVTIDAHQQRNISVYGKETDIDKTDEEDTRQERSTTEERINKVWGDKRESKFSPMRKKDNE